MTWAKPGVKCVCVDDSFSGGYGTENKPKKGETYTIREVVWRDDKGGYAVRLIEIQNMTLVYLEGKQEPSFNIARFRPLVSKPTSMDLIRSIANGGDIVPQGDEHDARKVTAQ